MTAGKKWSAPSCYVLVTAPAFPIRFRLNPAVEASAPRSCERKRVDSASTAEFRFRRPVRFSNTVSRAFCWVAVGWIAVRRRARTGRNCRICQFALSLPPEAWRTCHSTLPNGMAIL